MADEPGSLRYAKPAEARDVTFTVTFRLARLLRRSDSGLTATIVSDYGGIHKEQVFDHVVVNHGTVPSFNDELYFALESRARAELGCRGQIQERLLAGLPRVRVARPGHHEGS